MKLNFRQSLIVTCMALACVAPGFAQGRGGRGGSGRGGAPAGPTLIGGRFKAYPAEAVTAGTTAYMITLSGLSVVSLAPLGTDTRPTIATGARGIVNSADGTPNFKPGSFITISGANLAATATADTIPPPTVLGGS